MYELAVYPDAAKAERAVAQIIIDQVRAKLNSVLGLATGKTMLNVYELLWQYENDFEVSFARVRTFNLDEYWEVKPSKPGQFSFLHASEFFCLPQRSARGSSQILDGSAPNPEAECRRYEELIRSAGGIDLQLLGLGRNGHIGFNEPGSPFDSRTRLIDLSESTRLYYMKNLLEAPRSSSKSADHGDRHHPGNTQNSSARDRDG